MRYATAISVYSTIALCPKGLLVSLRRAVSPFTVGATLLACCRTIQAASIVLPYDGRVASAVPLIALYVRCHALAVAADAKHDAHYGVIVVGLAAKIRRPCRDLYVHFGRNSEDKYGIEGIVKRAMVVLRKKTCYLCCT